MAIRVGHRTGGQSAGAVGISTGTDKNRQYGLAVKQLTLQERQQNTQEKRFELYKEQLIRQSKLDERSVEIKARQMEAAAAHAENELRLKVSKANQEALRERGIRAGREVEQDLSQQRIDMQWAELRMKPELAEQANDLAIQRDAAKLTMKQKAEINKIQDSLSRVNMQEQSGQLSAQAAEYMREQLMAKLAGIEPPAFDIEQDPPTPEERFMQEAYIDPNGDTWVQTNNGWKNESVTPRNDLLKAKSGYISKRVGEIMKLEKPRYIGEGKNKVADGTEPLYTYDQAYNIAVSEAEFLFPKNVIYPSMRGSQGMQEEPQLSQGGGEEGVADANIQDYNNSISEINRMTESMSEDDLSKYNKVRQKLNPYLSSMTLLEQAHAQLYLLRGGSVEDIINIIKNESGE